MSLLRRAGASLAERRGAPPGAPWGDSTPPTNGMLAGGASGMTMTGRSAVGIGAVWACVRVLSDGLSTLPLRQYRGRGVNRVEIDPSPVIADPMAAGTRMDFLASGTLSLAVRGNAWGRVVARDAKLFPEQVEPVDPDAARVTRDRKTGLLEYRFGGQKIDADDVFHVRNLTWPGQPVGMNPIEELRTTLALARFAEEYGAAWFRNSANPSGALSVEGDLDEEETLALARAWMMSHQGIGNAGMPAVLTGGATWQQITLGPADAQFIESRGLSRTDIAMIFGIPPHMIGDIDKTTSWGAGIEQQEIGFVRSTLGGYIARWEHALTGLLPPGEYVEFDLRRRLRGDSVQRSAVVTNYRNAGILNADEARELYEDLPPLPDGKGAVWLQPLNMGEAGVPVGVPAPTGSK